MPIDPCYSELLADPRNTLRPPPPQISLADFRAATAKALVAIDAPAIHEVVPLTIAGSTLPLAMRLYRPSAARNLPVILFFHGGGFVLCSIDTHDVMCRSIALQSGAAVVSVDYRLAPESRFPGPLEDCHMALAWIAANATKLGLDAARIAVCGDSAGGNLAIATALLARQRGPRLYYMGLIYPMIDPACNRASVHTLAQGPVLSLDILRWFWECYLGEHGNAADPLVAVLQADLVGLPPATVLTAEFDPLRDEGEEFAGQLRAHGIPVISRRYLGMAHGFASMPGLTPVAQHVIADLGADLKSAFAKI